MIHSIYRNNFAQTLAITNVILSHYSGRNRTLKLYHNINRRIAMTDLDFRTIGLKIKERRQAVGITQEQVANELEVNPSHISNIECGRANPSLTALVKIANILQCSVDYFISGEYTYRVDKNKEKSLDDMIMDKLKYSDIEKKTKVLKLIELL